MLDDDEVKFVFTELRMWKQSTANTLLSEAREDDITREDNTSIQAYPREKATVTHSIILYIYFPYLCHYVVVGNPETDQGRERRTFVCFL